MKRFFIYFLVILFFIYFFTNNKVLSNVYSLLAAGSLKLDNIENGLNCYERSFDLGNTSSKDRLAYVRRLTELPINADYQEKLIKLLTYKIKDDAHSLAENYLKELRIEINNSYPDNYIRQASYNQKIMRWNSLPITYSIEIQESIPKFYLTEIIKAFTTWQTATEDKISFKQIKDNANIKIVFRQNNIPSADTQNKTIIAYTMPDIDADKLVSMQIKFNVKDPFGNYFSEQFIYDTALHEIAHALGVMGHSDFPDDILYLYSNGEQAKNENIPLLTQRDINTVNLLYEIKPEITNNYDGKFKYHPMIVIGKDIDIANAKEREAEIYIETAPNLPTGYIDLAEAKTSMNDYKSAVKCLKKALSLSDSKKMQALILHNLAVVNFLDTNYQESLNYIQKSLDMNYTEESLHILAKIYSNLREDKNAISIYDKLIDNNPHNIDYAIELTNIYVKNYQYINAVKVLKKYKKFNPKEKNNERFKPYGVLNLFSN